MAGPAGPAVDMNHVMRARMPVGPYRVVPGDSLQLEMPGTHAIEPVRDAAGAGGRQEFRCRVDDAGTVVLPIVGRFAVAGLTLAEIEAGIAAAYSPRYVKTPFPVYATVLEYDTRRVSIVGAVAKPGIYMLRHDQMSLVSLLTQAGGISENGAAVIRITRAQEADRRSPEKPIFQSTPSRPVIRVAEAGQKIHPAVWRTASAEPSGVVANPAVCAVFEWDGPPGSLGRITIRQNGRTLVRRRVDLGSELHRWTCARMAHAGSERVAPGDLRTRLSVLAEYLRTDWHDETADLQVSRAGWQATNPWRFEATFANADAAPREPLNERWGVVKTREPDGREGTTTLILPVKGLNIPFADIALEEGDRVIVEWPEEQFISVVGLVNRPGNFPYPRTARYTLIQAVAFAGGLDLVADPRYVSVYRLKPDGTIAGVTVQLVDPEDHERLTEALALALRPGDVVSVEHTPRTRVNVFFERIFRINLGLYLNPDTLWEE